MSRKNRAKRAEAATAAPEEVSREQPLALLKWWFPALTGLAVFLVYLRTLFPTITWQRYLESDPPSNDPDLIEIRKAVS